MAAAKPPLLGALPTGVPLQRPLGGGPLPKTEVTKEIHPSWNAWLSSLQNVVRPLGGNDTTANRPTANLYVGLQFFDTTLGLPIFVKSLNPTVWVNGAGATV